MERRGLARMNGNISHDSVSITRMRFEARSSHQMTLWTMHGAEFEGLPNT